MEYKKNRLQVILQALNTLEKLKLPDIPIPPFLAEAKSTEMIKKKKGDLSERIQRLRIRVEKILDNPSGNDKVYRTLQHLFKSKGPFHLSKSSPQIEKIYTLAEKRFLRGFPPRKANDTSCGDAINWEWIVRCAKDSGRDTIIVTRDSDYGVVHHGKVFLNDWLKREFRERVGRKQQIEITDRLTQSFKRLLVPVTPEEAEAEETLLETPDLGKKARSALAKYSEGGIAPGSLLDLILALQVYGKSSSENDADSDQ